MKSEVIHMEQDTIQELLRREKYLKEQMNSLYEKKEWLIGVPSTKLPSLT